MNIIKKTRRNNLEILLSNYPDRASLAKDAGILTSQISHFLNLKKNNTYERNIGNKIARRIEEKMGLGHGWMDKDRSLKNNKISQSSLLILRAKNNFEKLTYNDKLFIIEQINEKLELNVLREKVRKLTSKKSEDVVA